MEKEKWQLEAEIQNLEKAKALIEKENAVLREQNTYYKVALESANTALEGEKKKVQQLESMALTKSSIIDDFSAQLQAESKKTSETKKPAAAKKPAEKKSAAAKKPAEKKVATETEKPAETKKPARKGVSQELKKLLDNTKPCEGAISTDSILQVAISQPSNKASREEIWKALCENGSVAICSDGSIDKDEDSDDDGEEYEYSELDFEEVDEALQPKGPDGEFLDPDEACKNGKLYQGLSYEQ